MSTTHMTIQDLCDHYGVSKKTIYRWRVDNMLPRPVINKGRGGAILWDRADIVRSSTVNDGHLHNPAQKPDTSRQTSGRN